MMTIDDLHKIFLSSTGICTDTRLLSAGCMYFALKGENFDGNAFVHQALQHGAICAVSDAPINGSMPNCIVVDNTLETLQQLAAAHRRYLSIPIIGITGTNGKTTTKELINAVLSEKYAVTSTKGNLNNHIGVPLTILSMDENTQIGVVEMGANHVGEIADLCEICQPNFGIITNIGRAHLEGFLSYENIIFTKNALYLYVKNHGGTVFVHADDTQLMELSKDITRKTFGTSEADLKYSSPNKGFSAGIELQGGEYISSKLFGDYNCANIAAACCVGIELGLDPGTIKNGIEKYVPSNNRSQMTKTDRNILLLDAYNANPSSMEAAIQNFAKMEASKKMLVLGSMFELGNDAEREHERIANIAESCSCTDLYFVGEWYRSGANCFKSTLEFVMYLQQNPIADRHILIKGSRGMKLETIIPYL